MCFTSQLSDLNYSQVATHVHTHACARAHTHTHARTHARTPIGKDWQALLLNGKIRARLRYTSRLFVNFLTRWVWSFAIIGRLWSQRLPVGQDQQMLPLLQAHERNQISISASLDWFGPFLCPHHNYVRVLPQTSTVWVFVLLAIASSGGGEGETISAEISSYSQLSIQSFSIRILCCCRTNKFCIEFCEDWKKLFVALPFNFGSL